MGLLTGDKKVTTIDQSVFNQQAWNTKSGSDNKYTNSGNTTDASLSQMLGSGSIGGIGSTVSNIGSTNNQQYQNWRNYSGASIGPGSFSEFNRSGNTGTKVGDSIVTLNNNTAKLAKTMRIGDKFVDKSKTKSKVVYKIANPNAPAQAATNMLGSLGSPVATPQDTSPGGIGLEAFGMPGSSSAPVKSSWLSSWPGMLLISITAGLVVWLFTRRK
jgi:hypothetical protein